jgi:hypothetical protein
MRWLAGKLGLDRLKRAEVILPDDRFFPDPYTATPADARLIFDRVCGYMKLDPRRFDLAVLPPSAVRNAPGLYYDAGRPQIVLTLPQLADPGRLVASIAHELAYDILLQGGVIAGHEEDHEPLTDLIPVFLGLGVFLANAPVRERTANLNWNYFEINKLQINKQGYLPSRMLGYALALFAYVRGEAKPDWSRYLRPDASQPFKEGLRYLLKTGDSLFHPDTSHLAVKPPTSAEAIERLSAGSATVRAMTLHDLATLDRPPAALLDAVVGCLRDRDTDIQIAAARLVPRFGEAAHDAVSDMIWCLASRSATLRTYAAAALPVMGGPAVQVVPELTRLLEDPDEAVIDTAAAGLCQLAPLAASAVPALVEAMRIREIACHSSDTLADALIAIDPPSDVLEPLLEAIDPEIRRLMLRSLRSARSRRESDESAPPET